MVVKIILTTAVSVLSKLFLDLRFLIAFFFFLRSFRKMDYLAFIFIAVGLLVFTCKEYNSVVGNCITQYCTYNLKVSLSDREMIPQDKKDAIMNLYTSGIEVEFISMQVDLDIPSVISVLREVGIYPEERERTESV
jgi:hypothetical protein